MTCGLVHASYNLPEWQAAKLTFFAPCIYIYICNPWLVMCAKQCQDQSLVSSVLWAIQLVAPKGKG